jgi:hypothetical protein
MQNMAIAGFETSITLHGTPAELQALENAFREYVSGKNGVMFNTFTTPEPSDGCVQLFTTGPFGRYHELNDVDVFRDMAHAAPNAAFEGTISGSTTYNCQTLKATLKNGLLHISTYFEDNEIAQNIYTDYFRDELPYEEMVSVFRLDEETFDEDSYEEFTFGEIYEDFTQWDYDRFVDAFDYYLSEDVDEEQFEEILEAFKALNIPSFDEFLTANEGKFGDRQELDYDPVAKAYIGCDAPVKAPAPVWDDGDDDDEDEDEDWVDDED